MYILIFPLFFSYQVESGHWECVTVLIESGACVDACDPVGRSVLYVASQRGHARCVELLLGQSASCLLTEHCSKWGPLHVAGTECMYVWISLWYLSLCGSLTHLCVCWQLPTATQNVCGCCSVVREEQTLLMLQTQRDSTYELMAYLRFLLSFFTHSIQYIQGNAWQVLHLA